MATTSVPIGCVLPYAGNLSNTQLLSEGWSICNGNELQIEEYTDLYNAIGHANGGDGESYFNLPNFQGWFLRGVDPTGKIDQGASTRQAATNGGNVGPNAGSIEAAATALPTSPFQATIPNLPNETHEVNPGGKHQMLQPGSNSQPNDYFSTGGGDHETRPINAYVNFIIKLTNEAQIPLGAIAIFCGSPNSTLTLGQTQYCYCGGSMALQNDPLYSALFHAIGTAHGGNSTQFNLPDYRGRFLRGVDNGAGIDPDANIRIAMADGGNPGDMVGSVQSYATGLPTNPFAISILLGSTPISSIHFPGHHNALWNNNSVSVSMTSSGGDQETRPCNVYVDFYIQANYVSESDYFPIGGVIALPTDTAPSSSEWLLCNGSTLDQNQYSELFKVISTNYGSGNDTSSFNIPDFTGQFLRGTDYSADRDPDASTRTASMSGGNPGDQIGSGQNYATALPISSAITCDIPYLPVSDIQNAIASDAPDVSSWSDSNTPVNLSGGDTETRPVNVNVNYYIKWA